MQPELLQGRYEVLYLFAGIWHKKEATVPAIFKIMGGSKSRFLGRDFDLSTFA
jgi:hypothetical protein